MRASRIPALLLFAPLAVSAAILPDTIGDWQKGTAAAAPPVDAKTWQEYGLKDSETTTYKTGSRSWTISAWRFADATGAYAAFDQLRPKEATPVAVTDLGAETASNEYVVVGNYLFFFNGLKPKPEELNHLVGEAPKYVQAKLPRLQQYLPAGALPGSERYIIGPVSLSSFAPAIPPSVAAFHFDAEAVAARYKSGNSETLMLVFNYPDMEIARDRLKAFQAIPGIIVKRTGPLLALTLNAANADDAERLLSQVRYQAEITMSQHVPTLKDNPANLFLNIVILCGILAALCLMAGIFVGAFRMTFRRAGASGEGDAMISLHLTGRQQ